MMSNDSPNERAPKDALSALRAARERSRERHHEFLQVEGQAETPAPLQPVAQILTCSELNVPPEAIFDVEPGALLVNQVAGNVVDDEIIASIAYGSGNLSVPLIVVLGHTNCGIVRAALSAERIDGNVGDLLYEIFRSATEAGSPSAEDPVDDAVRANVLNSVRLLRESQALQHLTRSGRVQVAGAVFNSSTSEIVWLGD